MDPILTHLKGKDSWNVTFEKEKKLIAVEKLIPEVRGPDALEALFNHPLYNLPQPELQEDDWLLKLKESKDVTEKGSEEESEEEALDDSQWWVKTQRVLWIELEKLAPVTLVVWTCAAQIEQNILYRTREVSRQEEKN